MRKILFTIVLALSFRCLPAQVTFSVGAKWHTSAMDLNRTERNANYFPFMASLGFGSDYGRVMGEIHYELSALTHSLWRWNHASFNYVEESYFDGKTYEYEESYLSHYVGGGVKFFLLPLNMTGGWILRLNMGPDFLRRRVDETAVIEERIQDTGWQVGFRITGGSALLFSLNGDGTNLEVGWSMNLVAPPANVAPKLYRFNAVRLALTFGYWEPF